MKTLFTIVCALVFCACQKTSPALDSNAPGTLEFRGEASPGETGAQEFTYKGKTIRLSKAKHFDVDVWKTVDGMNNPAIGVKIAEHQAEEFGDFTEAFINERLAYLVEGEIIFLPTVMFRVRREQIIERGPKGFTEEALNEIIATIKAGSK